MIWEEGRWEGGWDKQGVGIKDYIYHDEIHKSIKIIIHTYIPKYLNICTLKYTFI